MYQGLLKSQVNNRQENSLTLEIGVHYRQSYNDNVSYHTWKNHVFSKKYVSPVRFCKKTVYGRIIWKRHNRNELPEFSGGRDILLWQT